MALVGFLAYLLIGFGLVMVVARFTTFFESDPLDEPDPLRLLAAAACVALWPLVVVCLVFVAPAWLALRLGERRKG